MEATFRIEGIEELHKNSAEKLMNDFYETFCKVADERFSIEYSVEHIRVTEDGFLSIVTRNTNHDLPPELKSEFDALIQDAIYVFDATFENASLTHVATDHTISER